MEEVKVEGAKLGPIAAERWVHDKLQARDNILKMRYKYKPWVRFLPFTFLPVWIINIDVLRRMAGMERTLMSSITGGQEKLNQAIVPPEAMMTHDGVLWFSDLTVADPTYLLPLTVWALMGYNHWRMTKNSHEKTDDEIRRLESLAAKIRAYTARTVRRCMTLFVVLLGPLIVEVPSAVVAYWAAGTATQLIGQDVLKKLVGVRKTVQPATPLTARLKVQK